MTKLAHAWFFASVLLLSIPGQSLAMDEFERELYAAFKLSGESRVRFEDCIIDIQIPNPRVCTADDQYQLTETKVDLREVKVILLRGRGERQFLEFYFNQRTRSGFERAFNSLMDRTLNHEHGDLEGTPQRRYATAERILTENGVQSGTRSIRCDGLIELSLSSSLSEYVLFEGQAREQILQALRAELEMCRVGM
ncbi:hypothetical protein [Phycobacter sp. K97]|uniref:hypothetical protein n=1 Tax=Phycobacter sedimenti TaxID=3133977 RepID=UPI00311E7B86